MKWFKNKWADAADATAPSKEEVLQKRLKALEVEKKDLVILANDTERLVINTLSRQQDEEERLEVLGDGNRMHYDQRSHYDLSSARSMDQRSHYDGINERSASRGRSHGFIEYQMLYGEGGDTMLHACVYAIAQDVSRVVQRGIVQKTGDLGKLPSLPLARPNGSQSLQMLIEEIMIDALLVGNGFLALDNSNELFRLDPKRMRVYPDAQGHLSHYGLVNMNNTSEQRLEKERVVHLKLFDPNQPMWGVGPAQAARNALLINDGETKYLAKFYKNGARPSGFISFDKDVDIDEAERAFKEFISLHARQEAHGKIAALVGGAKFEPMSLTPVEGGVVETRRLTQDLFQAVFGIPAFRLMDLDDADYANAKQQERIYDLKTVIPWSERIADVINMNQLLVPSPEVLKLQPHIQPILNIHRDEAGIASAVSIYVTHGVMSRDRVRERFLNEPPIDDPSVAQYGPLAPLATEPAPEPIRTWTSDEAESFARGLLKDVEPEVVRVVKLTHEQAEEIRAKYLTGNYTQTKLSEEYGVAQRTISRIVRDEAHCKVQVATRSPQ